MKQLTPLSMFLYFIAGCFAVQGIWMAFFAENPWTIAPVFSLGFALLVLGLMVIGILLSLVLCVWAAIYAYRFDDDEGNALGLGVMGLIGWVLSLLFLLQVNVMGEPIEVDSGIRFAAAAFWALTILLATLRSVRAYQRNKPERERQKKVQEADRARRKDDIDFYNFITGQDKRRPPKR